MGDIAFDPVYATEIVQAILSNCSTRKQDQEQLAGLIFFSFTPKFASTGGNNPDVVAFASERDADHGK